MALVGSIDYVEWDDGHKPGSTNVKTIMAKNHSKSRSNFLSIFDNLLDDEWCSLTYNYAFEVNRPWGIYVSVADILDENITPENLWKTNKERAIGIKCLRALFDTPGLECLRLDPNIHGCAIWCLASGITNSVEYHIDYAELFRYEHNVIHPPLYAGTYHVSPLSAGDGSIIGGSFCANLGGLDHYRTFGYKGALKSKEEFERDFTEGDWVKIAYKRNRLIIHDGDYPHLSTPVKALSSLPLKAAVDMDDVDGAIGESPASPPPSTLARRVILGFNFFPKEVAECCTRAPEHSDAFNRTVKLYQMMSKLSGNATPSVSKYSSADSSLPASSKSNASVTNVLDSDSSVKPSNSKGKFTAKDIAKNPALARLIVSAAKRAKEIQKKEESELERNSQANEVTPREASEASNK